MQYIVAVNTSDQPLGLIEKYQAHREGILHRAFSIFIFRPRHSTFEVLLQKRAQGKYHSSGLWTNTCCSHAEENVSLEVTAQRRLEAEMGFSCDLHSIDSFYYRANLGNGMIEHEIDHVFVGLHDPQSIKPDPEEVEEYQWREVESLLQIPVDRQNEFTAWFFQAFDLALKFINISSKKC